ncbi:MAG: hypothetical protein N3A01_07475 [Bacteroidales bacterium]|nr:hypothetical protein [Bacteroidales bacterium]
MQIVPIFIFLVFSIPSFPQYIDSTFNQNYDTTSNEFYLKIFKSSGIAKLNSTNPQLTNLNKPYFELLLGFHYYLSKNIAIGFNFSTSNFPNIDTITLRKLYNIGIEFLYNSKNAKKTKIHLYFIPSISNIQLTIPSKNKIISNTLQFKVGSSFSYFISKKVSLNAGIIYYSQNYKKFVYSLNKPFKLSNNTDLTLKFSGISILLGVAFKIM